MRRTDPAVPFLFLVILILASSECGFAHEPDEGEVIDIPEVGITAERPVAASSQQFIPDKEIRG